MGRNFAIMSVSVSRWIPAAVAVAVVAAGAIAVPLTANAAVSLAPKSAAQVLELIGNSKVTAFSGTVETTSNLGLPSLPSVPGASSVAGSQAAVASILSLVSTPQTARVYVSGKTDARVQVVSSLAEQDVIRGGSDLWQYDSKKNTVVHVTLPKKSTPTPTATHTPAEIAHELITRLGPTTNTSVGTDARVAGRTTYTLVLTPKATDTLIGSVSIAVDSETGLPLEVAATARGEKATAFEVAFSSISFATPAASTFDFTPPKGATVTEQKLPSAPSGTTGRPEHGSAGPTVVGTGWDAVVQTPADPSVTKVASDKTFAELTTAVAGGRVFHTSLVNVLVTTDGRLIAESVSVPRLQAVAAGR